MSSQLSDSRELAAWNQAHERLHNYLMTFGLSDQIEVSRLALKLLDQAREKSPSDPSDDPITTVMEHTQQILSEWLAMNLEQPNRSSSQMFSIGCIALLLSRIPETSPGSFLKNPLPGDQRDSMRRMLLITGPDFQVSSMTPRDLDYGPMLKLARHTWHRWNFKEIFIAMLFWAGVYLVFYWWLSEQL